MEESIYDLVISELLDRQRLVRDEIRQRFKKTKPFRQEPISNKELLLQYEELTPEKKLWLRQQFGDDAVLPYFERMERIKERYQKEEV